VREGYEGGGEATVQATGEGSEARVASTPCVVDLRRERRGEGEGEGGGRRLWGGGGSE
jgi:hypothetical protein